MGHAAAAMPVAVSNAIAISFFMVISFKLDIPCASNRGRTLLLLLTHLSVKLDLPYRFEIRFDVETPTAVWAPTQRWLPVWRRRLPGLVRMPRSLRQLLQAPEAASPQRIA